MYSCTHLSLNILALLHDYYLKFPNSLLSTCNIISEREVYNSQNFLAKCTQKRNILCSFFKRNLGTTCHRTSLTISETIYTSEAQNYAKSALKSDSLAPPPP